MTEKKEHLTPRPASAHVPRSALAALAGGVEMAGSLPGSSAALPMSPGLLAGQPDPQRAELVKGTRETSMMSPEGVNAPKLRRGLE